MYAQEDGRDQKASVINEGFGEESRSVKWEEHYVGPSHALHTKDEAFGDSSLPGEAHLGREG